MLKGAEERQKIGARAWAVVEALLRAKAAERTSSPAASLKQRKMHVADHERFSWKDDAEARLVAWAVQLAEVHDEIAVQDWHCR